MNIKKAETALKNAKVKVLKKLLADALKIQKLGGDTVHDTGLLRDLIKKGRHSGYSSHKLEYGGEAAINAIKSAGVSLKVEYSWYIPDPYSYWPGEERLVCKGISL